MFALQRIPEPEAMASQEEVEAYTDFLDAPEFSANDEKLVRRILDLGIDSGDALDVGCGPGQIAFMLAKSRPELHVTGIDLSDAMLLRAAQDAANMGLASRVTFQRCEPNRLGIPDSSMDLIYCNSVLHHMDDPVAMMQAMEQALKPGGALLMNDLCRPGLLNYWWHVRWYGRDYTGLMRQLYRQSVRAAYTLDEVRALVRQAGIQPVEYFQQGRTHLGYFRKAEE
jgi:ubiquinone/menaquinone biosynthesis C-methylase UbiE